jgi:hypothetical protein
MLWNLKETELIALCWLRPFPYGKFKPATVKTGNVQLSSPKINSPLTLTPDHCSKCGTKWLMVCYVVGKAHRWGLYQNKLPAWGGSHDLCKFLPLHRTCNLGQRVNEHSKLKPLGVGTMKLIVNKEYSWWHCKCIGAQVIYWSDETLKAPTISDNTPIKGP